MAQIYTTQELGERIDLSPAFSGSADAPVAYVPVDDMRFNGSIDAYLKLVKRKGDTPVVFKLCPTTSRRNAFPSYAALEDFKATDTGWESSLSDATNAEKRESGQAFRDANLPFLRMYMMGNSETKIICPLTGYLIDARESRPGIIINLWEQHHFKVKNRTSVQKEDADPGDILRRMDFSFVNGETVDAIKDMMRTIFLSPTGHKEVHNTWNNSDITNYQVEERPWVLQSQANWDVWMNWLGEYGYARSLFGSFEDWIASLAH